MDYINEDQALLPSQADLESLKKDQQLISDLASTVPGSNIQKSIKSEVDRKPQANTFYLLSITFLAGVSTMQNGAALAATGPVAQALRYKLNWGDDKPTIDFLTTVISTSSIVGLALGNIFGGDFVAHGRRITLIRFNILGMIATAFTFYLNFWSMCFGRMLFGLCNGVMLCATSKIIVECIPNNLIDQGYATSTNIFINFSLFVMLLLSMGMPTSKQELLETNYWYIMFGAQIPLQVLAVFLHTFVFTEDTIIFCIKNGKKDEAISGLRKVYPKESKESIELMYEQTNQQFANESSLDDNIWNVFVTSPNRKAAWMCMMIAFFNNMGGVSIIGIFATTIFDNVHKGQLLRSLSLKTELFYIGLSGFIGAVLGLWTVKYLTRRALFIGGHLIMAVQLFSVGHFIDTKQPELALMMMCAFLVLYQMTEGPAFWVYIGDVVSSDSVIGICLFFQQILLNAQSMGTIYLINSPVGVNGLFYLLGIVQVAAFFLFTFFLKETKGLSDLDKKSLYAIKEKSA